MVQQFLKFKKLQSYYLVKTKSTKYFKKLLFMFTFPQL